MAMTVTKGIEVINAYGNFDFRLDCDGGIQDLISKKKLIYIGDWKDQLRDLVDTSTKAQLKEAKSKSSNWREDPEVLKHLGYGDPFLNMGRFGLIEPNDTVIEVEDLYSYGSELVRVGYITTRKDLIDKVMEAQGSFEL